MSIKKRFLQIASLTAFCVTPILSAEIWVSHKPIYMRNYVDYQVVSGGDTYPTWQPPGGSSGTNYFHLHMDYYSGNGACYTIWADPGTRTSNPDIRIWTNDGRSIDDDGPNGSYRPRVTAWITGSAYFKISAYSSSSNTSDFIINSSIDPSKTSASQCDDGVSPFYNKVNDQITRANTTVN